MGSESFTNERILRTCLWTTIFFAMLYRVICGCLARFWAKPWQALSADDQRALASRIVSVTSAVIATFNSYHCLVDPHLIADPIHHVSDMHYTTSCWVTAPVLRFGLTVLQLCGFMVYDTVIVLLGMNADREGQSSALTTLVHHFIVLACMPIGLYYNNNAWMGSGDRLPAYCTPDIT